MQTRVIVSLQSGIIAPLGKAKANKSLDTVGLQLKAQEKKWVKCYCMQPERHFCEPVKAFSQRGGRVEKFILLSI